MAASTLAGDVPVINPPPPRPHRPRVLLVGTALSLGAVVMLFAGLIGLYVSERRHSAKWFPAGSIPLTPANIALFTLLLSIPMVHWAAQAVRNNDRVNSWLSLGLTALLGVAFINATVFIWSNSHIGVDKAPGLLLYVVTGAHVALVAVALVLIVITAFRTLGDSDVRADAEAVTAVTLSWDVTVAIFAVIWYAIYVTK